MSSLRMRLRLRRQRCATPPCPSGRGMFLVSVKSSASDCFFPPGLHLIKDADSVSPEEAQAIDDGRIINSRSRCCGVRSSLAAALPDGANSRMSRPSVKVSDRYGGYPVRALLCHETFWKSAVDVPERADLVVIDLHGYHWNNIGTAYELQRVVDRFPIERCLVLATRLSSKRRSSVPGVRWPGEVLMANSGRGRASRAGPSRHCYNDVWTRRRPVLAHS